VPAPHPRAVAPPPHPGAVGGTGGGRCSGELWWCWWLAVVSCDGAGGFGGSGNMMVATAVGLRRGFWLFFLFQKSLPRAISTLCTRLPRGIDLALGIGLFANPAVSSALFREFPLGKDSAEERSCAESIFLSAKAANPVVTRTTRSR
jgi:hypothetical protein